MKVIELPLKSVVSVETAAGSPTETIDAGLPQSTRPSALSGLRDIVRGALARVREGFRCWRRASTTETVGSYRLMSKLGQGGMGEVMLGHHQLLDRPAAIKRLRSDKPQSADANQRFEWEVRAASGLTHPNTISIYDFGSTPEGGFYYAMEYLQGLDLQHLVDQHGAVPAQRAVFIVDQILGSLGEAHRRGILHRDIKPSNVFLTERGGEFDFVKVLDFGLAQEIHVAAEDTGKEGIVGTPLYMAPEAFFHDQTVDGRSDLYSLGSVAYFLLAGHPVFEKRSTLQILADQASTEPASFSELGIEVSPELQAVLSKALAKSIEDRFATAEDFRAALRLTPEWGRWTQEQAKQWWTVTAPDLRANAERPITRPVDADSSSSVRVAA